MVYDAKPDTEWEWTEPNEYRRTYKGFDLCISVKPTWSKLSIDFQRRGDDVSLRSWFDGRIRGDTATTAEDIEAIQSELQSSVDSCIQFKERDPKGFEMYLWEAWAYRIKSHPSTPVRVRKPPPDPYLGILIREDDAPSSNAHIAEWTCVDHGDFVGKYRGLSLYIMIKSTHSILHISLRSPEHRYVDLSRWWDGTICRELDYTEEDVQAVLRVMEARADEWMDFKENEPDEFNWALTQMKADAKKRQY